MSDKINLNDFIQNLKDLNNVSNKVFSEIKYKNKILENGLHNSISYKKKLNIK